MKVVVAGGTGLVGSFLLKDLDANPQITSVIALTRSAQENYGKVEWKVADLGDVAKLTSIMTGCDAAISCLGTTMKSAGSKAAFEKVDLEYVVNLGQAAKAVGANTFRVISAVGAGLKSKVYYNRIKGKMEIAITDLGFKNLIFFQPSLLLGPRKEYRLGEKIGTVVMKLFSPLMMGSMRKSKPIHVKTVAQGIANSLFKSEEPTVVFYDEILVLAGE